MDKTRQFKDAACIVITVIAAAIIVWHLARGTVPRILQEVKDNPAHYPSRIDESPQPEFFDQQSTAAEMWQKLEGK